MDRRSFAAWAAGLAPLASAALAAALLAAEPTGNNFSWQTQGPALPGSKNSATGSRPRYDETYPPLRTQVPIATAPVAEAFRSPVPEAGAIVTQPPVADGPGSPNWRAPGPAMAAPVMENRGPASPALAAAARQAQLHIQQGTELGNRRGYFSARAEFVQALRVVAQALDAEHHTDGHSQALAAGIKALEESDDFIARGQTFESELNVAHIAAVHRTPVVRSDAEGITPRVALERYYTFAQEQLATSMGTDPAGSAALTAMGKLYTVLAEEQPSETVAAQAKAMAVHQAALIVDANNAVAANELGVLLARFGRPADARGWLEHSVSLSPQAATWHNLAVVQQQLGNAQLSEQARQQEQMLARQSGRKATSALPQIRWVSPRELDAAPADRPARRTAAQPGSPVVGQPPVNMRSEMGPAASNSMARLPVIQPPPAASF